MAHLADVLAQNLVIAATTQAQLRNGRRIRHNLAPQITVEDDTVHAPSFLPDAVPQSATDLSPHSAITLSPLDLPSEQFRSGLDRRKENRTLLMDWLRTALVEGVDFGRVHLVGKDRCDLVRAGRVRDCNNPYHWSKPSLFKPGAEKISGMLGMTVHYPSLVGYEAALLGGQEIKQVMLRCELHDAHGRVVAEGVGARTIAQDYGDLNKSLKMAEKSAHIDATLRLAGLSEVFTQDLEDQTANTGNDATQTDRSSTPTAKPAVKTMPTQRTIANASAAKPSAAVTPKSATASSVLPAAPNDTELITSDDAASVRQRIAEVGIGEKRVLAWLYKVTKGTVTRFDQLNVAQCTSLLKRLDVWVQELANQPTHSGEQ